MANANVILCLIYCCVLKGGVFANQDNVDYMADNLHVNYKVVDNFDGNKVEITFTNRGEQMMGGVTWEIYITHMRRFTASESSPIDVEHINGWLSKLIPAAGFGGFPPDTDVIALLSTDAPSVSRTDALPNWYVVSPGTIPRTLLYTTGEELDFVEEFVDEEQYKRSQNDKYSPYTSEERFAQVEITDMGQSPLRVIPTAFDDKLNEDERIFLTTGDWVVVVTDEELSNEAQILSSKLDNIPIVTDSYKPASHYIALELGDVGIPDVVEEESYSILSSRSPSFVVITGRSPRAVYYGIVTLLAMNEDELGVPSGELNDGPRLPYRGIHIDLARNFFTKERLMKLIEVLSSYKINHVHLHMTDDEGWRLEIPDLPELTQLGSQRCHDLEETRCVIPQLGSGPGVSGSGSGFYSVQDYKDILVFSQLHHVSVVTEIDMPAHSHAAVKAMEERYRLYIDSDPGKAEEYLLSDLDDDSSYLSAQYFTDGVMNVCLESTYNFVEKVIHELRVMHQEAQVPLNFNFGGDEVPFQSWSESPVCAEFMESNEGVEDLEEYFGQRVASITADLDMNLSAWEDGLLHKGGEPYDREALPNDVVTAFVWNNIWESGRAENAYTLANAGYMVVLAHATHLYFDHPQEPDPEERGLYWATRYTDTRKTLGYTPEDVYANVDVSTNGDPLDKDQLCSVFSCTELDDDKIHHIIGMQGHLWTEIVRTSEQMDFMNFPRVLALAERAWHKAEWEEFEDNERMADKTTDWEIFANTLGYRELARLDKHDVKYRVPVPGARITAEGFLEANSEFPGLPIRYSVDNENTWHDYTSPVQLVPDTNVHVIASSTDRRRTSRSVEVAVQVKK